MPFLSLNGHTIKVFNATPRQTLTQKGGARRSFKGQIRDPRRNIRRAWKMDACFFDYDEATMLENVINGLGHYVGFVDGMEATTGLNPDPGFRDLFFRPSTSVPSTNITGMITTPLTGNFRFDYDAQLGADWTVHWREDDSSTWEIITKRSDGAQWVSGVRNDAYVTAAEVTVSSGVVQGRDANSNLENMTDLAILPYLATESHILSWHAATERFSPLPVLRVEGDLFSENIIWGVGQVGDVRYIQKPEDIPGIGWLNNAKIVSFEIAEVNETFIADTEYVAS